MVAKISFGSSLYGALAYNGEKINKDEGKLLATNKIFDDGSGKTDIARCLRDFQRYLSPHVRTEKPVVHISLNPHPDDVLTDMEMENIAREYLERMGYGNQPYMVYKHEDIDRHHMHIVTIRVDENGKCLDSRYNYHRSKAITRDLEEKYSLHKADRKQRQSANPLRKVDVSQGDVKKQVANTVKSLCATYKFQSLGEYRALLSLYNISLEEVRGEVGGREYHGFVYSATDNKGNKVGNPFKASSLPMVFSASHLLGPRMSLPSMATTPFSSPMISLTQFLNISSNSFGEKMEKKRLNVSWLGMDFNPSSRSLKKSNFSFPNSEMSFQDWVPAITAAIAIYMICSILWVVRPKTRGSTICLDNLIMHILYFYLLMITTIKV